MKGFKQFAFLLMAGLVGMSAGVAIMWGVRQVSADEGSGHEHELTLVQGEAATCFDFGLRDYWECPECNLYYADADGLIEIAADELDEWRIIPKLKHQIVKRTQENATCIEAGHITYYYCYACGKCFTDENCRNEIRSEDTVLAKHAHHIVYKTETEPTCEHDGCYAHYECVDCHHLFADAEGINHYDESEIIIQGGHYTDNAHYFAEQPATCTEAGHAAYYVCARANCNQKFKDAECKNAYAENEEVIAAQGHRYEHLNAVAATCITEGRQECYHCLDCDKYFADQDGITEINPVIPMREHIWQLETDPRCLVDNTATPYRELTINDEVIDHNAMYRQSCACADCDELQGAQEVGSFATLADASLSNKLSYEFDSNRIITADKFTINASEMIADGNNRDFAIQINVADNYSRSSKYSFCNENGLISSVADMSGVVSDDKMTLTVHFEIVEENGQSVWQFNFGDDNEYTVDPVDGACLIWNFDWDGVNTYEQTIKIEIVNA